MRNTGFNARMVFAERFTAAVIDRPFYAGLRMIATRPRGSETPAEPKAAPALPRAA